MNLQQTFYERTGRLTTSAEWLKVINEPRDTKYSKAINRLTGDSARVYHLIAYKDPQILSELNLVEEWDVIRQYSDSVYSEFHFSPPPVPTVEEISENINGNPLEAFGSILSIINPAWENIERDALRTVTAKWTAMIQKKTSSGRIHDEFLKKSDIAIEALHNTFPNVTFDMNPEIWDACLQLNRLLRINQNMPREMMKSIETAAIEASNALKAGQQVDLNAIGKHVLSSTKDTDLKTLAANLNNILPLLQNL